MYISNVYFIVIFFYCFLFYQNFRKAHHHVPFSIWGDDARTVCWLWSDKASACDWGGSELIAGEAQMIRCDPAPGEENFDFQD